MRSESHPLEKVYRRNHSDDLRPTNGVDRQFSVLYGETLRHPPSFKRNRTQTKSVWTIGCRDRRWFSKTVRRLKDSNLYLEICTKLFFYYYGT